MNNINNNYKIRILDEKVDYYLKLFGAVVIVGPKYSGKTWLARNHSKSEILLFNNTNEGANNIELAKISPKLILSGEKPRLIDEWQEATNLWDEIRYDVDKSGLKGQYLLTGSSTPNREGIFHSGAGRFGIIYLRTMSLFESGESTGDISLKDICDGNIEEKFTGEVDLLELAKLIVRGGWPANLKYNSKEAIDAINSYIDLIVEDDICRIDGIKRDKRKIKLLLRSLARNECTTVSNLSLKKDISDIDYEDLDIETVKEYLNLFDRLYLVDNDKPYSINVRSKLRVKQSEKRHFVDPSIACALLDLNEDKLIKDLDTLGFLFESLVIRDLKIYASTFDGTCYHYQDYNNNEIDSIIELRDGSYCAFEVKLGANKIEEAAKNLIRIKNDIIKNGGKPPKELCVICGLSNAIYKRPDGVIVVPITALRN